MICERDLHNRGENAVEACELISDAGAIVVSVAAVSAAGLPFPPRRC